MSEETDDLVKRLRGETEWTNQKPYFHAHTKCLEAADRIEALTAKNERFREVLREIASDDFGLQGLIEDGVYEETETSRYYAAHVSWRRKRALAALEKQP
jgi:hypothetical protein